MLVDFATSLETAALFMARDRSGSIYGSLLVKTNREVTTYGEGDIFHRLDSEEGEGTKSILGSRHHADQNELLPHTTALSIKFWTPEMT